MNKFGSTSDVRLGLTYPLRILLFFLITFLCLLVGAIAVGLITHGGMTTLTLRIATVVQDVVLFVLPAVLVAMRVTDRPASLLGVDRGFSFDMLLLSVMTMVVSIPAMNALVDWNENIVLPEALSGLEGWMKANEDSARQSVEAIFGGTSVGDLVLSMMIVAVLAAFSEELFFRGALQRLMASGPLNPHVAIWLTAFIFSAFHMQFYGFFPRLLLGAYFGYLLWWSQSVWVPMIIHMVNNGIVVYSTWRARVAGSVGESSVGETADAIGAVSFESPWAIALSVLFVAIFLVSLYRTAAMNLRKD